MSKQPATLPVTAEEEGFWTQIEKEPDNFSHHFAFAGWLEEIEDPRAQGMFAIAKWCFKTFSGEWDCEVWNWDRRGPEDSVFPLAYSREDRQSDYLYDGELPGFWFVKLDRHTEKRTWLNCVSYSTNRDALNDVAQAFAKLTAKQQASVLAFSDQR